MMTEKEYIRKGDIFYVELGTERNGHIQNGGSSGTRPCIVVNNQVACIYSPVLLVVPITSSNLKKQKNMPTHLIIEDLLPKRSVATFEQVLTVNRFQLKDKIGNLSDDLMKAANEKLEIAFGLTPQYS